jgi:hypothetical protein
MNLNKFTKAELISKLNKKGGTPDLKNIENNKSIINIIKTYFINI